MDPFSFHPLIKNTDLKMITKTLATRMATVTPLLNHLDQTGLIRHRQAHLQTLQFYQHVTTKTKPNKKTQKKYSTKSTNFIFSTLRKFGFGEMFIHWIKTLQT